MSAVSASPPRRWHWGGRPTCDKVPRPGGSAVSLTTSNYRRPRSLLRCVRPPCFERLIRPRTRLTTNFVHSRHGPVASPVARFCGVFGADWPTWAMGPRRGLRLPRSRRSPGDWRTGVSPHHKTACGDVGGRVTDFAGSSAAAEWLDPEGGNGAPIPVRRLRLNLRNRVAVATANGQARLEWATRGRR